MPVVGLIVVGNLPNGCVPEPLAAAEVAETAVLSVGAVDLGVVVGAEAGLLADEVEGETRLFFRLSIFDGAQNYQLEVNRLGRN